MAETRTSQLQQQLDTKTELSISKAKNHAQELNQAHAVAEQVRQRLRGWQIDQEQAMSALKASHARKIEELTRLIAFAASSNQQNVPSSRKYDSQNPRRGTRNTALLTIDEKPVTGGNIHRQRSKHRATTGSQSSRSKSSTFSREHDRRRFDYSKRERERGRPRAPQDERKRSSRDRSSRDIIAKDTRSREWQMRTVASTKGQQLVANPDSDDLMFERRDRGEKSHQPVLEPPLSPQWRSSVLHDVAANVSGSNFLRSVAANLAADRDTR